MSTLLMIFTIELIVVKILITAPRHCIQKLYKVSVFNTNTYQIAKMAIITFELIRLYKKFCSIC